jgi:hypothetical protein
MGGWDAVIDTRRYPYALRVDDLRELLAETDALRRYLAAPAPEDDWRRAQRALKHEILAEVFPDRKRPANMASGWAWSFRCDAALRELLDGR